MRTEQDLFVRLIDSTTKQVWRYNIFYDVSELMCWNIFSDIVLSTLHFSIAVDCIWRARQKSGDAPRAPHARDYVQVKVMNIFCLNVLEIIQPKYKKAVPCFLHFQSMLWQQKLWEPQWNSIKPGCYGQVPCYLLTFYHSSTYCRI